MIDEDEPAQDEKEARRGGAAQEFVDRLVDAVHAVRGEFRGDAPEDLMRSCGIEPEDPAAMVAQCAEVCADDLDLSDPSVLDLLQDELEEERIQSLEEGEEPTPEELRSLRERYCEARMDEGLFTLTYYYCVEDLQGRAIYFSSTHGDGGDLLYCDGPWTTLPEPEDGFDGSCLREWTGI
jgi:hypothetical protein